MRRILSIGLVSIAIAASVRAETGREIAQKSQTVLYNFKTLKVAGEMKLLRGTQTIGQRSIVVEQIEQQADDKYDQALVSILGPSSLKDTRLISWSRAKGDDQQWLVTPRTGRVQRIAERGRQAAFVSSDFSYEDILKWQLDAYDYTAAGQQSCPAGMCIVVDSKPHNRFSNYALLKLYFDGQHRISKIDYFADGASKPRKTLVQSDYVRQGDTWQPTRSVITDHDRGTSTEIVWSGYQMNTPVDERVMSPNRAHE